MAEIDNKNLKLIFDYYQKGLSAREISVKIKTSIHAVYYFLRKNKILRRSAKEINELRFNNKPASFEIKNNLSAKEKELFVAGVMLYWAEGSKWPGEKIIDFANSDAEMIRVFLKFLRKICRISESKLRIYLYCHENQNVEELKKYWSLITKVSEKQFTKPYIKKSQKNIKNNKMKNGLIHVRYNDKKLINLMRIWIKDISLKF